MGFFDFIAAPFRRKKPGPTQPVGVANFPNYSGFVVTGETNPSLIGTNKWRTYGKLIADEPIIATAMRYRLALGAKARWSAESVDDTPEAVEYQERLEEILDDMRTPMPQVVQRSLLFADLGYSMQTWRAKRRDDGTVGLHGIRPIAHRTVYRWETDEVGDVLGATQKSPHDNIERYIPRTRMMYLADTALNDMPEGLGLLRHCVEASRVVSIYERLEGIGYQTDLSGIPVGRAPLGRIRDAILKGEDGYEGTTVAQHVSHLETFIKNRNKGPQLGVMLDSEVHRGEDAAKAPSGFHEWDVQLLTAAAANQAAIHIAIMREIKMMALVFGVEGLLIGMESTGAYALAKDKTTQLMLVIESLLGQIRTAFDRDIVTPIWALNGWPEQYKPRMKTDPLQRKDVADVMGVLEGLARAGAPLQPGDPAVDVARHSVDLPPAPEIDPAVESLLTDLRDPEPAPMGEE